jgi:hypothetical protein
LLTIHFIKVLFIFILKGGRIFSTSRINLIKPIRKPDSADDQFYEPNCLEGLADGVLDTKYDSANQAIFIDRNPRFFSCILDYLRTAHSVTETFRLPTSDVDLTGLLKEAEHFNVQGLIDLIQTVPQSNILTPTEVNKLLDLCQFRRSSKWRLIYRASTDGFGSDKFHAKCDNIPRTLVLILTTNSYVFGGCTSKCWDCSGSYQDDPSAFLFSFVNPDNKPIKLNYNGSGKAIYGHANNGPTFGGGHDIFISTHANTNMNNHSNLGHSFRHPSYRYESNHAQGFLSGSYNFQVGEIEVFHLIN